MMDAVEVKTTVNFQPFSVPYEARLYLNGDSDDPAVSIDDLSPEALDALAERWLYNLYASVSRKSPFYRKLDAA